MNSCEVRYPKRVLVISGIPLLVAAIGFVMATEGRGHWSIAKAALCAGIGVASMLYVGKYKTVFSPTSVQQFQFLRPVRTYGYEAIQHVRIGEGKGANTIILTLSDGKRVKVFGAASDLLRAQALLRSRLPLLATR